MPGIKEKIRLISFVLFVSTFILHAQTNEECLMCHEDAGLTMERNGKSFSLHVDQSVLLKSAHKKIECITCHKDAADPDFKHAEQLVKLKKVNCESCHSEYANTVKNDIHHKLNVGEKAPDCKTCHSTHNVIKPSQVASRSSFYCGKCHEGNVLSSSYHIKSEVNTSCMECHNQKNYTSELSRSVHSTLSCSNCHGYVASNLESHADEKELIQTADCYLCHGTIAAEHKESIHGISLAEGINEAAQCWDCHGSHDIYPVKSDSSRVYPKNLVNTCGKCHDDPEFNKKFYSTVKKPALLYTGSVHGKLVAKDSLNAASCVTCHGVHNIKNRVQSGSKISAINVPNTCAECHKNIVDEYKSSIHWMAVKKGVREAPTCNDCHSEHSIHAVNTLDKREELKKMQENTCLQCHQNMLLSHRYGLGDDNASSYQDSYHGLAVMRGDTDAAMCIDCHGVHSILPKYHEASTINEGNIRQTCMKCHTNATQVFALSYSHNQDEGTTAGIIQRMIRNLYFWMIIIVIGGMFLHNFIIYIYDVRAKLNKSYKEIRVPRFNKNEIIQHFILIISFVLLAITGFQLKYPESWWAKGLNLFMDETIRQNVHRASAVVLVILSVYHVGYMIFTKRGRDVLVSILPRLSDVKLAIQNVKYYLGLTKKHPEFDNYNYIEKAEYWALIWGTLIMGLTGLFLWFPTLVGDWAPIWLIRVCEIIHFYEAILATLAIVVWHWFFVIYRPALRFTFIDGQMTLDYYKDEHKLKFKKILAEWVQMKKGNKTEDQLSNYTKMFISTLRNQGIDVDSFVQGEIDKDENLKFFVEKNGLKD